MRKGLTELVSQQFYSMIRQKFYMTDDLCGGKIRCSGEPGS